MGYPPTFIAWVCTIDVKIDGTCEYGVMEENGQRSDGYTDDWLELFYDCAYDTDKDGDCHLCCSKGGCENIGGPFKYKSKYQPGTPSHLMGRFDPNTDL
jgi:hypothetical protein